MKRTLALATALSLALSIAPAMAAQSAPRTCGAVCFQTSYDDVDLGAWFLDGRDGLLLAESSGFRVMNTFTQQVTFRYTTPTFDTYIDAIARSENSAWVVIALSSGEVYRYDTEDWSRTRISAGLLMTDVQRVAVSNSGEEVYVGRRTGNAGDDGSTIQRFHNGILASGETYTNTGGDYGITELVLDDSSANLYVGWNGFSPTFVKLDAMDIAAGAVAGDNDNDAWSGSSIAVAEDGTVYGANESIAGASDPTANFPHILKMNASTLSVIDTIDSSENWNQWAITLSEDDQSLFSSSAYQGGDSSDPDLLNKIEIINASTMEVEQTLSIPGAWDQHVANIDADFAGRYLAVAARYQVYIVSLDSSPITLTAEYFNSGEPGSTQLVDWQYSYLNPTAKFKWFEVKYVPAGKKKAKVKRVKRVSETEISQVRAGTSIRVRAVYSEKRHNTAWATAVPAVP
jgi:hypothetical protein